MKLLIFFLSAFLWLVLFIGLDSISPKYLPDGEFLLKSDFEKLTKEVDKSSLGLMAPWICSKTGVAWQEDGGFSESGGVKLIASEKSNPRMIWKIANPQRFSFLEFRGRMRAKNIVKGEKYLDLASFVLYFEDKDGKFHWELPHVAGRLTGTSPWRRFSRVFWVPEFAETAHVVIHNSGQSGTMWCDDISIRPVRPNSQYLGYQYTLVGLGVMLVVTFIFVFKAWQKGGWLVIMIGIAIMIGVLSSKKSAEILLDKINLEVFVVQKIGHLIMFFLLGLVSSLSVRRRLDALRKNSKNITYVIVLIFGLLLFAVITELIQSMNIERTPRLFDWAIDATGILVGISLGWGRYIKRKFPKSSMENRII